MVKPKLGTPALPIWPEKKSHAATLIFILLSFLYIKVQFLILILITKN